MNLDEIPGWCDYDELLQEVVDSLPAGNLVEVGNFLGRGLISLALKAKASGKPFRVFGIELGTGSGVEQGVNYHAETIERGGGTLVGELHRNILKFGVQDIVTLIVAPSFYAAQIFPHNSLDFVFIDAQHTEEAVTSDIEAFLPKVRPGKILAGHDWSPHWHGVQESVRKNLPGFTTWGLSSWKYIKPNPLN